MDQVVKEFYNVVWKAVFLQKRLSIDEAKRVVELFKMYVGKNLELGDESRYIDKALEIALEYGITVYDALYIALAIEEGLPLLTLDEKQRKVAENMV